MHINPSVLANGKSHLSNDIPSNQLTFHSTEGEAMLRRQLGLIQTARRSNSVAGYCDFLEREFREVEKELSHFLRDDSMIKQYKMDEEDQEGWQKYHLLLDQYDVLKYAIKKLKQGPANE